LRLQPTLPGNSAAAVVGWMIVAASLVAANRALAVNQRRRVIVTLSVTLVAVWFAFGGSLHALM